MDKVTPFPGPRRAGPVPPDLLGSALFLYAEYLQEIEAESTDDEDEAPPEVETRAVLDRFADELGTDVATTLNLFLRVTALQRLLAASPALARLVGDEEATSGFSEEALVAAARLDLYVHRVGKEGHAEFNAREFREAIEDA